MATPGPAIGILLVEVILFSLASLTHAGVLIRGHENARVAIAEAIIAVMLGIGFIIALARPAAARRAVLIVQGFAIAGALGIVVLLNIH
jgi:hypothetical protein